MAIDVTSKRLGDAGEYWALSQFIFAGKPAAKMPDSWKDYDLVVETGQGLARISVKTRSERAGWKSAKWFVFDEKKPCDWLVFVFKSASGALKSWVVPFAAAREHGNRPTAEKKDPHLRYVYWTRLINDGPLARYENNWELDP